MTPEDVMFEVDQLNDRVRDLEHEMDRLKRQVSEKPARHEVDTLRHDISNHVGSMTPHRFGQ